MRNVVKEIAAVLESWGWEYSGASPIETAEEWAGYGFGPDQVDAWCLAGCWDAETAATLRDAGVTPRRAAEAAAAIGMVRGDMHAMYAACNGDLSVEVIIDAAKRPNRGMQ